MSTGETRQWFCKTNTCEVCAPIKASALGRCIALARPQRMVRFSQVGDDFSTVQARMNRVHYDLRERFGPSEWCWVRERNPAATGFHVHAWQRGPNKIPQADLVEIADRRGFGRNTDIRRFELKGNSVGYGFKGVTYGLKGAHGNLDDFLVLNGNRLLHQSRGFFLDEYGQHVRQREAIAASYRVLFGEADGEDQWVLKLDTSAVGNLAAR